MVLEVLLDGKEKRLALGGYPDVGLKEARAARDEARVFASMLMRRLKQQRVSFTLK